MKNVFVIIFIIISQNVYSSRLDTITIQLKWKHQFQFAGYYVAKEKGFYEDLNLHIKLKEGTDFCNPVDSVLRGSAQMGIGGTDLLIQRNLGKPIIALLAIYQHSPLVLLSKKDTNINNIHDIIGKRVMIENQSTELYAYFSNENINLNSFINFPYKADISLFIDNKVDFISAYITDEPYLLNKKKINYQIFSPQSAGIDFYSDILFTSEKFARNNPKELDAFINATKKGWTYALSHIDETTNIIFEKYSKEKELNHLKYEAKESEKLIRNDIVEIGYMYNGRWQNIGETYVKFGMLDNDFKLANFVYSKENMKSKFSLIYFAMDGIFVLVCIISMIMFSYFFLKYLNFLRTKKSSQNDKSN